MYIICSTDEVASQQRSISISSKLTSHEKLTDRDEEFKETRVLAAVLAAAGASKDDVVLDIDDDRAIRTALSICTVDRSILENLTRSLCRDISPSAAATSAGRNCIIDEETLTFSC